MKDKFIKAYTENITRPGADKLLAWIESSDFFTAPASTRFHLSSPGGLLEHSLHVFERMKAICANEATITPGFNEPSMETIAVCGLLHDICKANFYAVEMRNRKNDQGRWEQYPFYVVDDKLPYLRENGIEVDDVAAEKPPAKVYVDDRALLFDGNPKGLLEKIQQFRPWQEGGPLRGKPPVPNCRKCIAHVYERTNDGWHEDEFAAWFHTWGSTFEEFDNGAVPVTTGIVEDENGKVWNTAAENIRFID